MGAAGRFTLLVDARDALLAWDGGARPRLARGNACPPSMYYHRNDRWTSQLHQAAAEVGVGRTDG